MGSVNASNPNAVVMALLATVPYNGTRGRLDTLVPADIGMTSAECRTELRKNLKKGKKV